MLRCEEVETHVMETKAHWKEFFSSNFSLKVRPEQLQPCIQSNQGASYLVHICEIYSLAQLVQLSLVRDRHLGSVFDMREGVRSACSPPASSRGGLGGNVVRKAALHGSRQFFPVLLRRSIGLLLLYPPVLLNSIVMGTASIYLRLQLLT